MSSPTGRMRAFRESPHYRRIWKFGTVSVISTVICQLLLFAFYPHLISSAMLSNVFATSISTVPAYWLNRRWTWGKRGKSHLFKEVMPFWVMAFAGLVLSTVVVGVAAKSAHFISSSQHAKVLIVHVANLFAYGAIWVARYSILNRYLFGTHTHQRAAAVIDTVAVERPVAEVVSAAEAVEVTDPALVRTDPSH